MGSTRTLVLRMCVLAASVCWLLGLHPWVRLAHAEGFTTGCPAEGNANAGCVCWSDDGILKMVCNQPAAEGREPRRESSRDGEVSVSSTSASRPRQAGTCASSLSRLHGESGTWRDCRPRMRETPR